MISATEILHRGEDINKVSVWGVMHCGSLPALHGCIRRAVRKVGQLGPSAKAVVVTHSVPA